jgi:hypothetical protein
MHANGRAELAVVVVDIHKRFARVADRILRIHRARRQQKGEYSS